MNIIDKNSFIYQTPALDKSDEWLIPEEIESEIPLNQDQIENFLTSFNIDITTAQQVSSQFVGLSGQELISLLNRDDNNILSKDEVLSAIGQVSDNVLEIDELDIIFTGEGDNRTLDTDAFRAFIHTIDSDLTPEEADALVAYFEASGKTADEIIEELTGEDDIVGANDIQSIFGQ